jgi:hypothetical protein
MKNEDQRPLVSVGHIVLPTDRMEETAQFMRTIGMRPIFDGAEVSIFELRGGTHLLLTLKKDLVPGPASFDLMVDDLPETHRHFTALGLDPTPIVEHATIYHHLFTVREPAGHRITIFSSHVEGRVV